MDVETAKFGNIQHGLRQNQAVSRDDHDIGARCPDGFVTGRILEFFRLADRDAVILGFDLDRTGGELHATSTRAIGLSKHQHHLVSGGDDGGKRLPGKLWRAGENDFHLIS